MKFGFGIGSFFFINRDYCIQLSSSQNESEFLIIGVDPDMEKIN